jgi:hypothetical protein
VWKSTGSATPSNRRRVDGVVNLISTQPVTQVADAAKKCPASATLILTPCGGAAADVPKDATAVYHRDALCGNQPVN